MRGYLLASQRGDDERAVEYIERAIRSDEHRASFHGNLARALYRQGRFAEAIFAYQQALCCHYPAPTTAGSRDRLLLRRDPTRRPHQGGVENSEAVIASH
jgi:tetratricopeptide (TPR) repeat protein